MPEDTVRLGIRVGSKSVVTADDRLDKLGRTAATTERKTERMGKTATRASKRMSAGFSAVARAAGVMAAAVLSVQSALGAIGQARQFNAALGEVSTLIEGTAEQMGLLEREAKRLAGTFGGPATAQVQAFYQAISAGADGVAGAAGVLEAANKLAIGGITDVTTGVDVLTTAMNVYAAEGLTATEVSDSLFVAMRAGKTTIGALSGAVGRVIPLAQKMGVGFDEVNATIAALTKGGISTAESVTGLRAILASVAKPTKEASDLAKQLGLEFDSTAVASKGLAGFIKSVEDATKGNTDQMALLFGGIEALVPALALTGQSGEFLAEIMEEMADKAGATETAFEKMQKTLDRRLTTAMNKFRLASLDVGQKLLQFVVPAVEALANNIGSISAYLRSAVVVLGAYAIASVGAAIATGRLSLSVKGLRVALISSGLGLAVVALGELVLWMERSKKETDKFIVSGDTLYTLTNGLTVAIGDEITQSGLLATALASGTQLSVALAEVKLLEAEARYENVSAIIAEQRALVVATPGFQNLTRQIANAQSIVYISHSKTRKF